MAPIARSTGGGVSPLGIGRKALSVETPGARYVAGEGGRFAALTAPAASSRSPIRVVVLHGGTAAGCGYLTASRPSAEREINRVAADPGSGDRGVRNMRQISYGRLLENSYGC